MFDKRSQDSLLNEAYQRTKTEINASHILIRVDKESIDTLDIYNRLLSYRSEFRNNKLEYLKNEASFTCFVFFVLVFHFNGILNHT